MRTEWLWKAGDLDVFAQLGRAPGAHPTWDVMFRMQDGVAVNMRGWDRVANVSYIIPMDGAPTRDREAMKLWAQMMWELEQ